MDRYTANRYIWLKQQIAAGGGSVPQELINEVEALDATVNGDETQDPPVVGLVDIVGDLEDVVEDLDIDINGDSTTTPATPGLKDRVEDLETTINGDSSVSPAIPPLLAGAGNMKITTLWTNSDTTQAFSAGDVTLSSADYDLIVFVSKYTTSSTGSGNRRSSAIVPKGADVQMAYLDRTSNNTPQNVLRSCTHVSDSKYTVDAAYLYPDGSSNNAYVIPEIIYGIKIMLN